MSYLSNLSKFLLLTGSINFVSASSFELNKNYASQDSVIPSVNEEQQMIKGDRAHFSQYGHNYHSKSSSQNKNIYPSEIFYYNSPTQSDIIHSNESSLSELRSRTPRYSSNDKPNDKDITSPESHPYASCGPKYGNTTCPDYRGTQSCCSVHGICGYTVEYCHPEADCTGECWRNPPPLKKSLNGLCGQNFKNLECDPISSFGGCCSQFGYCGDSKEHCSKEYGCQSGCTEE